MAVILGIDPGLLHTGWGVIDKNGNSLKFIACGAIHSNIKASLSQRLAEINSGLTRIIECYRPDECAVEETFVNKNPLSSLKLGHARGAAMLTVSLAGLEPCEYAATLVKKSVTGVGRAEKEQVMMMVKQILPKADLTSADAADALAVAICHAHHANMNKLIEAIR